MSELRQWTTKGGFITIDDIIARIEARREEGFNTRNIPLLLILSGLFEFQDARIIEGKSTPECDVMVIQKSKTMILKKIDTIDSDEQECGGKVVTAYMLTWIVSNSGNCACLCSKDTIFRADPNVDLEPIYLLSSMCQTCEKRHNCERAIL